jgi:hypothetical protein
MEGEKAPELLIADGHCRHPPPFLMRQRSHMLEMAQAFVIASTTGLASRFMIFSPDKK